MRILGHFKLGVWLFVIVRVDTLVVQVAELPVRTVVCLRITRHVFYIEGLHHSCRGEDRSSVIDDPIIAEVIVIRNHLGERFLFCWLERATLALLLHDGL